MIDLIMMSTPFREPVVELMGRRYSCRRFAPGRPDAGALAELRAFVEAFDPGPLGTRPRFVLVDGLSDDGESLRRLGSYGAIRGAGAFLIGLAGHELDDLVDFGFLAETAVLKATELGLCSCWLGGSFRRSRFARAAGLDGSENRSVVCVVALGGAPADPAAASRVLERRRGGAFRKDPAEFFFQGAWGAGGGVPALVDPRVVEAVRLAPSSSNRQPWRLVAAEPPRGGRPRLHAYLERSLDLRSWLIGKIGRNDIQYVDLGAALAHAALAAAECGGAEKLVRRDPGLKGLPGGVEYIATLQL